LETDDDNKNRRRTIRMSGKMEGSRLANGFYMWCFSGKAEVSDDCQFQGLCEGIVG
jgi:hypothetical protein